ncbi:MAG: uracil-DNA glycosylase [bacterium]|nr:uracil-DNA glycosylase [bacterium]
MYEELEITHNQCLTCTKCPLHKSRHHVVFSDGVPNPKIMLIGEAPGYNEDIQGKPFVGKAGQLLDKIFASVGLSRNEIYICNTIKCRPPENRNPLPEEKEACWEYLKEQIDIIQPKIILLCGNVAVQSILGNVGGITKIRGKWFDGDEKVHGAKLMPIFHPSYLLRNDSREKGSPKWLMWQDIQEIKRVYESLG